MKLFYRRVVRWVKVSIIYSIYFWKNGDYDWDYSYLINLMRFKMNRMANTIEDNEIICANKRVAKQLRYAVYLIDRWRDDSDYEDFRNKFVARWGELIYSWEPNSARSKRLVTRYPKATTPELHKQAEEEFLEGALKAQSKNTEVFGRLFKHMFKYMNSWWD